MTNIQRTCEWCKESFFVAYKRRTQKFCDRKCYVQWRTRNQITIRPEEVLWTEKEEVYLEKMAGTQPLKMLAKSFQAYAKRMGLPLRSQDAISNKIRRMGLDSRCTLDNFSEYKLADILGVPRCRIHSWIRNRGLKVKPVAKNRNAISIAAVQNFARQYPGLFAELSKDVLIWLLGKDLADICKSAQPIRYGRPQPVRCVETGAIYASFRQAAADVYVDESSIQAAANHGSRSAGYHWERVDPSSVGADFRHCG